jgi:hypothetical protein
MIFRSGAVQVPGEKNKQKINSSQQKKPTSHTTYTYEDFWDWKVDGNCVHYDRPCSGEWTAYC